MAATVQQERAIAWRPQRGPQEALLACPIEDILYGGSRGGGKTDGFLGKWGQRYQLYGAGLRGIFVRRTYDELDEVVARSLEIYPHIGGEWLAGKRTWHFPGGARLKMRSLERDQDAAKYQGHSYTDVYIDEAGNFPDPGPINKLRATLRNPHGIPSTFNLSANPGGPGHEWLKKRYFDPAPQGFTPIIDDVTGEARIYIPSRLEDNHILMETDPNYRKRIMQSGPSWLVQAWLKGDWNATPEGGLIKAKWFKKYDKPPTEFLRVVISLDTAYKAEQHNDPSVATVWGETAQGYYLLYVWRDRVEYPELKRVLANLYYKWNADAILIEDKASGQSLIQEARSGIVIEGLPKLVNLPIVPIDPKGVNKVDRLIAVSSQFEAGLVHLPYAAPWLLDFEIELTTFPLAPHDDQVDSTSQFLKWVNERNVNIAYASTSGRQREQQQQQHSSGEQVRVSNRSRGNYRGY
jgi:predicted phage terminase large subunit-like protein